MRRENKIPQGESVEWEEGLGQDPEEVNTYARNKRRGAHHEAEEELLGKEQERQPSVRTWSAAPLPYHAMPCHAMEG